MGVAIAVLEVSGYDAGLGIGALGICHAELRGEGTKARVEDFAEAVVGLAVEFGRNWAGRWLYPGTGFGERGRREIGADAGGAMDLGW